MKDFKEENCSQILHVLTSHQRGETSPSCCNKTGIVFGLCEVFLFKKRLLSSCAQLSSTYVAFMGIY